mgnify:CR=1 FL=1
MSSTRLPTRLLALATLSICLRAAPIHAAPPAHDHDHAGAPAKLSLNAGKKWATDEPLRKAMATIRGAMEASLPAIHAGKLADSQYAALTKTVNDEIAYIVSNCKLDPKADAQLHLIIAQIADGTEAMDGKSGKLTRQDGAVKVLGALKNYGSHFDHPAWKPIRH